MSIETVPVGDLRRAWTALRSGEFRRDDAREMSLPSGTPWAEDEAVVAVVGATGGAGCSTAALALGTAACGSGSVVRVLDCAAPSASGLVGATTAELDKERGWQRGSRGLVQVERLVATARGPRFVPRPRDAEAALAIVDVGWELSRTAADSGWLGGLVRQAPHLVVVTRASVPAMRRLEVALASLQSGAAHATPRAVQVAVVGPRRRRWARGVEQSAGSLTRAALDDGRVHVLAEDRHLAVRGVTAEPLPRALVTDAARLLAAVVPDFHTDVEPNPSQTASHGRTAR